MDCADRWSTAAPGTSSLTSAGGSISALGGITSSGLNASSANGSFVTSFFPPDAGSQTALIAGLAATVVFHFVTSVTRSQLLLQLRTGFDAKMTFGFLEHLDGMPSDYELNDFDLWTDIELAINPDGSIYKTTIVKTSGKTAFDVAAVDTVMTAGPYDPTPEEIRSSQLVHDLYLGTSHGASAV